MSRILSIDFGRKRCGIAVTDPACIVANPLTTVRTCDLYDYILRYVEVESVGTIVVGKPTTMRGEPSESTRYIIPAVNRLRKSLPNVRIVEYDERFTSVLAHRAMLDGGLKKTDRRCRETVDMVSAAIILNDYLQSREMQSGL